METSKDPFAAQRPGNNDPFSGQQDAVGDAGASSPNSAGMLRDRRMSKEWGVSFPC